MHKMNLQSKYFDYILSGTKRVELRLLDEKRKKINVGDTIIFKDEETDESFEALVINLHKYDTFENLFKDFDISILADVSMTKQQLLDVLETFYTKEKQSTYGVVGIEIKLV